MADRRSVLIGMVLLLGPASAESQSFRVGMKLGVSAAGQARLIPINPRYEVMPRWEPVFGATVGVALSDHFELSAGAQYVGKGYWARAYRLAMAYLEFPITARYRLLSRGSVSPVLLAGLASALKLSCHETFPSVDALRRIGFFRCFNNQSTSRWDHSALVGAGFELGTGRVRTTAEATFSRALNNLFTSGAGFRAFNQTATFLAGFTYGW